MPSIFSLSKDHRPSSLWEQMRSHEQQYSDFSINTHRFSLQFAGSQLLATFVSLIVSGITQYPSCSRPIISWFSSLAFLLPLPQLMLHSLHRLCPLQGSQYYPPIQWTELYHYFLALVLMPELYYIPYRNEQAVSFPCFMSILVTWSLKQLHLLILSPSWLLILQFLSAALTNI